MSVRPTVQLASARRVRRAPPAAVVATLALVALVAPAFPSGTAGANADSTPPAATRDGSTPQAGTDPGAEAPPPERSASLGLWIDPEALSRRPTDGSAWDALLAAARASTDHPDLSDKDDPTNVRVLAKALLTARTGDARAREDVRSALQRVRGTERGANALAVGRELMAYVLAADLIALDGPERQAFADWLATLQRARFRGRTLRSTHQDRPNNWGTHAGASRLAVALYLGDTTEIERAAHVFRGWLGERDGWRGFSFGDGAWQPPLSWRWYGVNPPGATRKGHSIDGVLPDDQRRSGRFRWPPPKENYVWEALQGAVAQAVLLERAGYDPWSWGDRALLRAVRWLHEEAEYPAEGDDTWIPHLVNHAYGSDFPAPVPSQPGKGMGFSDWTHGAGPDDAPATEANPRARISRRRTKW